MGGVDGTGRGGGNILHVLPDHAEFTYICHNVRNCTKNLRNYPQSPPPPSVGVCASTLAPPPHHDSGRPYSKFGFLRCFKIFVQTIIPMFAHWTCTESRQSFVIFQKFRLILGPLGSHNFFPAPPPTWERGPTGPRPGLLRGSSASRPNGRAHGMGGWFRETRSQRSQRWQMRSTTPF